MAQNAAQHFRFEDFGAEDAPEESYSQADIDAAAASAREAALADARLEEQRRQTALLETIASRLASDAALAEKAADAASREVSEAARALLTGLVGALGKAREVELIEAALQTFFRDASAAGRAVLKVAPETFAAHRSALADLIETHGASVDIEPDDALVPGDCRIEWRTGALARLRDHALAQIETIFQQPDQGPDRKATEQ